MTKLRFVLQMIVESVEEFNELRGYDEHTTNVFRLRTEGVLWFATGELKSLRPVVTTKHEMPLVRAIQALDAWERKNGSCDALGAPLVAEAHAAIKLHRHHLEG